MTTKDPNSIGEKLYLLRKKMGLSSTEVAKTLGFATHKSIIDIEFGRKKVTNAELEQLAKLYAISLNDLTSLESRTGIPNFKALFRAELSLQQSDIFENKLAKLYPLLELYFDLIEEVHPNTLMDNSHSHWMKNYPSPTTKLEAINHGEVLADHLRNSLGLGDSPITNILLVCELLNIVTLFFDFNTSEISGLYCQYNDIPLILINTKNNPVRKRFSIAHEICHFLVDNLYLSKSPELTQEFEPFEEKNNRNYREVRANAFAAAFLMPEKGLSSFLKHFLGKNSKTVTIHDIVHIAYNYGVSFETACYRLKNLDLITDTIYEEMRSLRPGALSIKDKLYGDAGSGTTEQFSDNNFMARLKNIAIEAYQLGKLSIGKLCEIFDCPILDQKKLLQELQIKPSKIVPMQRPNPLL